MQTCLPMYPHIPKIDFVFARLRKYAHNMYNLKKNENRMHTRTHTRAHSLTHTHTHTHTRTHTYTHAGAGAHFFALFQVF